MKKNIVQFISIKSKTMIVILHSNNKGKKAKSYIKWLSDNPIKKVMKPIIRLVWIGQS
ncbi:hypothetical protein Mucpa_5851 [Mucilaginibacter paludis DSM 18603]|uniref:Uncharacterized protein n=1 Tax=Mucilaginibacter paludis DSM 18603 TaxID=714943 RepID=H1Y7S2_9SPHI|nr:hypothetical protein Mucpa_5851 [Mucilaginibacter paludis DSM 18603]